MLDLDETIVYARDGADLCGRAYLRDFFATLHRLRGKLEVIVWTAASRSYAKAVVQEINVGGVIKHCVYRDQNWFGDGTEYTKDLSRLNRDLNYTLIVENTPDCVRLNPQNGIIVSDYEGVNTKKDETLNKLAQLIEDLITSGDAVPAFLAKSKMLRKQTVVSECGHEMDIFFLSSRSRRTAAPAAAAGETKEVKTNRDRAAAATATASPAPPAPSAAPPKPPDVAALEAGGGKPPLAAPPSATRRSRAKKADGTPDEGDAPTPPPKAPRGKSAKPSPPPSAEPAHEALLADGTPAALARKKATAAGAARPSAADAAPVTPTTPATDGPSTKPRRTERAADDSAEAPKRKKAKPEADQATPAIAEP